MKRIGFFVSGLVVATALWAGNEKTLVLTSPDGSHTVSFGQQTMASGNRSLYYEVTYQGEPVVVSSQAGLEMDNRI